jgi:hypothetical protein
MPWGAVMKMIAEYLEHAREFDRMAAEATDPRLKESLAEQAAAYRKLAQERAERRGLQIAAMTKPNRSRPP